MITRLSQLFVRTLREDPGDAEVKSHKLLVRAGYIRRQAPGVFAWLPLGLAVKDKLERVIHEEMTAAGAQRIHFPALLPKEPYEATGRWEEYGENLFRLQDRKGADYLLAPTHEEAFTLAVKDLYTSYKDLPLTLYQIQDKYRDEARPRAGILRGREFTMKDAYSFDIDHAGLEISYQAQRDAYERIFQRVGVDYVIVSADAGAMGGSRSEEFLSPTPIGEDTFVQSVAGYAANVEAYETPIPEKLSFENVPAFSEVDTPGVKKISELVDFLNSSDDSSHRWENADMLKHVAVTLVHIDGTRELVIIAVPGDRDVEMKRAEAFFAPAEVEAATDEDFAKYPSLVPGFLGPILRDADSGSSHALLGAEVGDKIRYFVDPRVVEGTRWVVGANRVDTHLVDVVYGRDFAADAVADVANVLAGDPAPDGSGPVSLARGIEIGHVFQLGTKYAEALGLKVLDEHGRQVTVTMGSYGIGVTRLLAVIAEKYSDDKGLRWPQLIAPYTVHVVATGKDDAPFEKAEEFASQLEAAGIDVLVDDRKKVSPGVKFKDAELFGMPFVIVVGKGLANNEAEIWDRFSGEKETFSLESGLLPQSIVDALR